MTARQALTRRALFGSVVAACLGLVGSRLPASADAGESMVLGGKNTSNATTTLTIETTNQEALFVASQFRVLTGVAQTGTGLQMETKASGAAYSAVEGIASAAGGSARGIRASSDAVDSEALYARATGSRSTGATARGVRYGVRGQADTGRGGVFEGARAAIKLEPSSATHPRKGELGDLVSDWSGRLWFCRGGTDWKRLA